MLKPRSVWVALARYGDSPKDALSKVEVRLRENLRFTSRVSTLHYAAIYRVAPNG